MENTGFSEINEERLYYNGAGFWFCEIAITGRCNFSCKYCNKMRGDCDLNKLKDFINKYEIKYIHLTGGEPTLYPGIHDLCGLINEKGITLGMSTNGSADISLYKTLKIKNFSISLDDYDNEILINRGYKNTIKIKNNIELLSRDYYVNVGLVIDKINVLRVEKIINYILSLGVSDIKLSISTKDEVIPVFTDIDYSKYPILNYRINRFKNGNSMRGLKDGDSSRCGLMLSDISIFDNKHYPCLVYAREGGKPIGNIDDIDIIGDRRNWYETHSSFDDPICKKYCMDFKCEFNREFEEIHEKYFCGCL